MFNFYDFNISGLKVPMDNGVFMDMAIDFLSSNGIRCYAKINEKGFHFSNTAPKGRVFRSEEPNVIHLAENDPRVKSLGRTYLETDRLTETQHKLVSEFLTTYFTKLGVSYSLDYVKDSEKKTIVLNSKLVNVLVAPSSFPIKKGS